LTKTVFNIKQIITYENDMKKTVMSIILLSILLAAAMIDAQCVSFSRANPYFYMGFRAPPEDVELPKINVTFPQNNTILATDTIPLSFDISMNTSKHIKSDGKTLQSVFYFLKSLYDISYQVDWQKDSISVNLGSYESSYNLIYNITLSKIPEGKHIINVTAFAEGVFAERNNFYFFNVNTSSSVCFTVDTVKPQILITSLENKTYAETSLQLNFVINENLSKISYVLDNQNNITVNGNSSLTGLSEGFHSVTVYATDIAGNVGSSETLTFAIDKPEPLPFLPIAVSVVASAVIAFVVVVYLKKRKR